MRRHIILVRSRESERTKNSSKQFHFRSSKSFPFNLWRCDVWMHVCVGVCFVDACYLRCREAVISNVGCKHQIQYKILNSTVLLQMTHEMPYQSHVESFAIFRCRSSIILLIFPGTKYYIEFPIHSIEKWFWAGNHFVDQQLAAEAAQNMPHHLFALLSSVRALLLSINTFGLNVIICAPTNPFVPFKNGSWEYII